MGHVTERCGKHYRLSRQTLHHMAYSPGAVLVWDRDEENDRVRYPCGGFVFVPDQDGFIGKQVSPVIDLTH